MYKALLGICLQGIEAISYGVASPKFRHNLLYQLNTDILVAATRGAQVNYVFSCANKSAITLSK